MTDTYSYLNDELALNEIRKHKWIESEKLGREIGFASAAIDWIQKYGAEFRRYRMSSNLESMSEPLASKAR